MLLSALLVSIFATVSVLSLTAPVNAQEAPPTRAQLERGDREISPPASAGMSHQSRQALFFAIAGAAGVAWVGYGAQQLRNTKREPSRVRATPFGRRAA